MTTHIFKIRPDEVKLILPVGRAFAEAGGVDGPIDEEWTVHFWSNIIRVGNGVIFALQVDDYVVGTLGAVWSYNPFTKKKTANEMFWYVLPDFRGKGLRLMKAYLEWVGEVGSKRVIIAHRDDISGKTLHKFYRRMGFDAMKESYYVKEEQDNA